MITRKYWAAGNAASPKIVRSSPNVALLAHKSEINPLPRAIAQMLTSQAKDRRDDQVNSDQDDVARRDRRMQQSRPWATRSRAWRSPEKQGVNECDQARLRLLRTPKSFISD